MSKDLLQIVADYSDGVAKTLELLEKKFGKINYTLAKNDELIPARGFLRGTGEVPYSLHGAGVTAHVDGLDVAFDFWPQVNDHVGFDAWQLAMFTKMNREAYADFAESSLGELEKRFAETLAEMERGGLLEFNQATKRYYPKPRT